MNELAAWLGFGGAFLSAAGIAVTLWGTRKTRSAFGRLRRFFVGPEPVSVAVSPATISVKASVLTPTVRVSPGDGSEWSDEEWQTEFERRLDNVVARLDAHDHDRTETSFEKLRAEDERLRAEFDSKLDDLDAEAKTAERWNVGGLVLAGIGAVLQLGAALLAAA